MFEAIVTVVVPRTSRREEHLSIDEPAHTEVYRLEFDSVENLRRWLAVAQQDNVQQEYGMTNVEKLTA